MVLWVSGSVAAFFVCWSFGHLARPLRKPLGVGAIILVIAPVLYFYELLRPQPFDLYVRRDKVDLEFAGSEYAEEVRNLNSKSGATIS